MKTRSILTGLAVTATLAACTLQGCRDTVDRQPPPPPTVTVQTPTVRSVTTSIEFTGRTAAVETVEIRARVTGFLKSVDFEPSLIVNAGDLLFTIEPEPFEATVAAARAQLASREAELHLAEVTIQKAKRAFDKGAVTDLEMAEYEAKREVAAAAVQGAQAAVETAEIDLGYTQIRAPITGRISRNLVSVGNLVTAGESTLLTTIVLDDPIHAYFAVDERTVLRVLKQRPHNPGAPNSPTEERRTVFVQLSDGSEYPEPGFIDFGENRVDPTTGTLEVRAEFANPNGILYPGMFARIRLPKPTVESILVPEIALQRDLGGPFLTLVNDQDIVERRYVELGDAVGTDRVILTGLEPADRVIVNGLQKARPGKPVTVQSPSPTSSPNNDA
ncbi:MAG: efflux RND transporter periplasmic adaptor subunit [Phycisphaerales bacterium]|nr:efflux RND transporter periplasmic adaptor subunit [Phycisphaerales bacterium]